MSVGVTMFDKIWRRHVVAEGLGEQVLLYVDRHLLHEGSGAAFDRLRDAGRRVRRPESCFATADHYVPTATGSVAPTDEAIRGLVESLARNPAELGISHFFGNCGKNGHLPIVLPAETVAGIRRQLHA